MKLAAFLVTTVVYGIVYMVMDKADSNAFGFGSWIDPFYFSFTTMSTVGYGDFSPGTNVAKMLVMSHQFILMVELMALLFNSDNSNNNVPMRMPAMQQMMPRAMMNRMRKMK